MCVVRGKKAGASTELMLVLIGVIVMAFALGSIFFYTAKISATNEKYFNMYLAKDLGLTVDTLNSIPGDLVYKYEPDTSKKQIDVFIDNVIINARSPYPISYGIYFNIRNPLTIENFEGNHFFIIKESGFIGFKNVEAIIEENNFNDIINN